MPRRHRFSAPLLAISLSACTTFGAVRSAEVSPGPFGHAAATVSGPMNDVSGWFWSFDCAQDCAGLAAGVDASAGYGVANLGRGPALALAVGSSGTHPYLDGYAQLGRGRVPFGVGARAGMGGWREHSIYGRLDVPLGPEVRLLLNPALFVHEGASPNGEMTGSFVGFVQGIGFEFEAGALSVTPAGSLVVGRGRYEGYRQTHGPTWNVFPTASLGLSLREPRRRQTAKSEQ
jgi:hypothetical protein